MMVMVGLPEWMPWRDIVPVNRQTVWRQRIREHGNQAVG